MTSLEKWAEKLIGPQKVGGTYYCHYWNKNYQVLAIEPNNVFGFQIKVRWDDGSTTTHSTAWDKRDREVSNNERAI